MHTWENLFKEEQDFPNGRGKRVNAMVQLEDDAIFKSPGDSVRFSSVYNQPTNIGQCARAMFPI